MKVRKRAILVDAEPYGEGMEDGWEYEDQLPADCHYDAMFPLSKVDVVRLFPFIRTLEGPYFIEQGDWIITGHAGERWPIGREKFEAIYDGDGAGRYRSRPLVRDAIRMPNAFTIHCSGGDLRGEAGSYLMLATPDDAYPVESEIFAATYEALE